MPNWLHNARYYAVMAVLALILFACGVFAVTLTGLAWGVVIVLVLAGLVLWLSGLLYAATAGMLGGLARPGWLLLAGGLVAGVAWRWLATGSPL